MTRLILIKINVVECLSAVSGWSALVDLAFVQTQPRSRARQLLNTGNYPHATLEYRERARPNAFSLSNTS